MQASKNRIAAIVACFTAMACTAAEVYVAPGAERKNLFAREGPRPTLPEAPPSAWIAAERKSFTAMLEGATVPTLVAPVQVQRFGLDRTTRSQMQLLVAEALQRSGSAPGNVFAIQRALGEGLRTLPIADLQRLGTALQSTRIVAIYAGHDEGPKLRRDLHVSLQVHARDGAAWVPGDVKHYSATLDGDRTAAYLFEAKILPAILRDLGIAPAPAAPRPGIAPTLPAKIDETFSIAEQGGAGEAAMLQLYALLAPVGPERTRERLFEQSLAALRASAPDAPGVRLMKARALFYLSARPAAVAALGKPRGAAEEAFAAFLAGNLADLQRATARIEDKLARLEAELELHDLQDDYSVPGKGKPPAYVQAFARDNPQWAALVLARAVDGDVWTVQENYKVRVILDELFPLEGFNLDAEVRGRLVTGKVSDRVLLGLAGFEHLRRVRASPAFAAACSIAQRQCARAAFLDLAEARLIANEVRALRNAGNTRGSYEEAAALAQLQARELEGQPNFAGAQARWMHSMTRGRSPDARDAAALRANALVAAWWEQGQSRVAMDATGALEAVDSDLAARFLEPYYDDLPMRDYWLPSYWVDKVARLAQREQQLRATNHLVRPVIDLARLLPEQEAKALSSEVANRFKGSPERATLLDVIYLQGAGDVEGRLRILREARVERPDLWSLYEREAKLLLQEKGAPREASEAYLRFPGFTGKGEGYDRVTLANEAGTAGFELLRHGEYDGARKLFDLSVGKQTGSGTEMLSEMRRAELDGRYADALRSAFARATRYNTSSGFRDYLGYLFVTGKPQDAWAGFNHVHSTFRDPQVWSAADRGLRMEGRAWKETLEWLKRDSIRRSGGSPGSALMMTLIQGMVDRAPPPDLLEAMKAVEDGPSVPLEGPPNYLATVPLTATEQLWGVPPSYFAQLVAPRPSGLDTMKRIHAPLVYFAEAWVPLRAGRYEEAADAFLRFAQFYPVEGYKSYNELAFALPYFAWAAAKSGDKKTLEAYLKWAAPDVADAVQFEHRTARAMFKAARGEHDAAAAELEAAFRYRNSAHRLPVSEEYQWVEICEWLFAASGDERYRTMALKGAAIARRMDPAIAWPYAVEARYSPPSPARERALGFALYLDPASERLAAIPEADKAAARAAFQGNNPFLNKSVRPGNLAALQVDRP